VRFTDPKIGSQRDAAFEVSLADDLEQRGRRFRRERQISDFINNQQAWSGKEAHGGRPAAFERGTVTTGCEVRGGGVVGAVAGFDGCAAERNREHRFADTGRSDEQHVRGVFQEPQGCEFVDECAVDGRLRVEVEVVDSPRGRQARETFEAGLTAGFGRLHFDV